MRDLKQDNLFILKPEQPKSRINPVEIIVFVRVCSRKGGPLFLQTFSTHSDEYIIL